MLRRVRLRTQERLDRRERGVAVRSLCVQQAHAVYRIADWARELPLECRRIVGRVRAWLERDDLHVETLGDGELHPAQRRVLPGSVGVEAEEEALCEPG